MALVGDTLVALLRDKVTPERWGWAKEQVLGATKTWPGDGIVVIVLMLSTSSPPDADTRRLMSEDLRSDELRLRKLIATPLGQSIWRSVVRTVVRALFVVSGRTRLQAVAANLEHSIQLVNEVATEATPPAAELRAAALSLFAALDVSPAAVA